MTVLHLRDIIVATDAEKRNRSIDGFCAKASLHELLAECADLDRFRQDCGNLYERVRGLFFLHAIHRFHLPAKAELPRVGHIPFPAYERLLQRRFEEAVQLLLKAQESAGPSETLCSALSTAYYQLGLQTLVNQVRRSVREVRGNQWMFRAGHPAEHPLRIRPELLRRSGEKGPFPILSERTPVRMDLTHSAWSDIFFLGMDYPEGARVLNVSIDLAVRGRAEAPRPPVEAYLRVIDEPVLRLVSVDLGASADLTHITEVFDFARDYLGLLKAAVIAAGIIPPALEGSEQRVADVLGRILEPGLGLEIVSNVNNIPKGSRLAVSTNLLGSLIAVCMRATGQARMLEGPLQEEERRLVAARAILGEWLGGSGGGWQDSGGIWPGIKIIEGVAAGAGDPEFGTSRGRLLPRHRLLGANDASPQTRAKLENSLILVHGGLAQNVGPILEMVTEKYLLRSENEWTARQSALRILDEIQDALRAEDIRAIGAATHRNFMGPIQTIIPWATNCYTESLIGAVANQFKDDFWGFWMLGGMSGGGMGFIVAPHRKVEAQDALQQIMNSSKQELQTALPFAMEPLVYDFAINERGTYATLLRDGDALLPASYYAHQVPKWLRQATADMTALRREELSRFATACRTQPGMSGMVEIMFDRLLPQVAAPGNESGDLAALLQANGFDREQHERIRSDLRRGLLGLAQNRLAEGTTIEDVRPGDLAHVDTEVDADCIELGKAALARGEVAVVTLAAGAGSRWTQGAGVIKALHPFCRLAGKHRTFLEVHLAKSRRSAIRFKTTVPHVVTSGYLTHAPTENHLRARANYNFAGPLHLSAGRAVGLRLIPMARDLHFAWEEISHQILEEQAQKVRESLQAALIDWARRSGEGADYTDNLPLQCLHPVGHWFEIPNLLRNGTLRAMLAEQPQLRHLLIHNVDTLGTDIDPAILGQHIAGRNCLTFEVIPRRLEDRGGGLARVDGKVRLVEGLALPREQDEFALSYYNTLTNWIDVDRLLQVFGLSRASLCDETVVNAAVRKLAARMPTYITLKEVKKRWGHGQEDVYPVCQFEKLWGDCTALPEFDCGFVAVPRRRGQQLKDQSQLDGWVRDGSAAFVESLCDW